MTDLAISDHALLRWMERVHGIDIDLWRELMRAELLASVDAYAGHRPDCAAFVVSRTNRVVTVLSPDQRMRHPGHAVLIPRVA